MAETLLAILLVTSSAKGSSLVYRWPPSPKSSPRLARPRPFPTISQLDNPWRAAKSSFVPAEVTDEGVTLEDDEDYEWKRPNSVRDRSLSFSSSIPRSTSRPNTPAHDIPYSCDDSPVKDEYNYVLGYHTEFLASILCPKRSLCHQKFELLVDDLAFIGHPVSAEADGLWRFKPERTKPSVRGRDYRSRQAVQHDEDSSSPGISTKEISSLSAWLHTFHLVLLLDLPDPSSSASGNISKYFDIIYEQIAFTITAVLFQEQVLSNFVEVECDALGSLRDTYVARGAPFMQFMEEALNRSSLALAMKGLYEAIKTSSMAYITIHGLPLELQLPPYIDFLLHNEDENEVDFVNILDDDGDIVAWGQEMSLGWRLPALAPWKGLLLLDDHTTLGPSMDLSRPHVSAGDKPLAEDLIKFLETASVTIPLIDMASLLDWDLVSQVFPTVRWLVHHRRAKVVDIVHPGLKTVFTLPPKFDFPLSKLTTDFEKDFSSQPVPPLPQILSNISTSTSKKSDFFTAVVRSKDLIPLYQDIVNWMLKRDMLITLHVLIRVVATPDLKMRVKMARDQARSKRTESQWGGQKGNANRGIRKGLEIEDSHVTSPLRTSWVSFSPKSARQHARQLPSPSSGDSRLSDLTLGDADGDEASDEEGDDEDDEEDDLEEEDEKEFVNRDNKETYLRPTMIDDPGRATPLQRQWLSAMSEGKDASLARRFEQINRYFDGKKTDDEILYKAEITRKQLREVLHHYDEYLQTFLHPS